MLNPNTLSRARPRERTPVEGAQAIKRAAEILSIVAAAGGGGISLKEVAALSGLHKATAHRIARALLDEGILDQDSASHQYRLGVGFLALTTTVRESFDIKALAGPSMDRLARLTQETVYLGIRCRYDVLCLDIRETTAPGNALQMVQNDRWPMGIGAVSLAILGFLPRHEAEAVISTNASKFSAAGEFAADRILRRVEETRRRGFALNEAASNPAMCSVGVPLLDREGRPIGSLCVTGSAARMGPERQRQIVEQLFNEARRLALRLNSPRIPEAAAESWRGFSLLGGCG